MILNIAQQLIDNEFTPMLKTNGKDIFCGGKQVGPCLYCVIAVDASLPDYKQRFEQMAGYLGGSYSMQNFNLVILGVFAAESVDEELKLYTSADVETFEQVNIIKWVLTPDGLKVFGKQPSRLLNIHTLLETSLTAAAEGGDLSTIVENSRQKRLSMLVSRDTLLTYIMLGVITLIFVAQLADTNDSLINDYGLLPVGMGQYYRVFTSMFLHGNFEHYISNALALYIFGTRTERYYGKPKFMLIYFGGGILAGVVSSLFLDGIAIGASGAIFALMGAVTAYSLKTKRSLDGFNLYFLLFFSVLGLAGGALMPGVDNIAHIAGFISGALIGFAVSPNKTAQ